MSDTKLDPRSLSSAVVREVFPPPPPLAGWVGFYWDSGFYDSEQGTNEDAGWYCSGKVHATREDALCELAGFRPFEGSALVEVGSALFGESASEGGKVECPNCLQPEEHPHFAGNLTGDGGWYFCPGRVPQAVREWIEEATERMEPVDTLPEGWRCKACNKALGAGEDHHVGGGKFSCSEPNYKFRPAPSSVPASEGGKVECPNCHPFGEPGGCTYCPDHLPQYRHQPAQPEPAAFGKKLVSAETHPDLFPWVKPHAQMRDEAVAEATKTEPVAAEMPEAVSVNTWQLEELLKYADLAEVSLRTGFHPPEFLFEPADRSLRQCIDAIKEQRDQWRTHSAQPANTEKIRQDGFDDGYLAGRTYERTFAHPAPAVAMTPELERCLRECESCVQSVRDNLFGKDALADAAELEQAIAAVRSQAAEAGKVRLPKVRAIMNRLWSATGPEISDDQITAALAELNAAEGRK